MRADLTDKSLKRLTTLHPQVQQSALRCYQKCIEKEIPLYIIWAKRTPAEQDFLYKIGRDTPGRIHTYTRSDLSPHCYGLALDFCLYNGEVYYEWEQCEPHKYWRWKWIKVMKTFEQEGWESGWRWYNFQPGHLQNLLGKTIRDYRNEAEKRTVEDRDYGWTNL